MFLKKNRSESTSGFSKIQVQNKIVEMDGDEM